MSLKTTALIKPSTMDVPAQIALLGTCASGLTSVRDLKANKEFLTQGKKSKSDEVNGPIRAVCYTADIASAGPRREGGRRGYNR